VVEYNPELPDRFAQLRDRIWLSVRDIAVRIEHVGSTAVEGLAAKPVIDLDVVIPMIRRTIRFRSAMEGKTYFILSILAPYAGLPFSTAENVRMSKCDGEIFWELWRRLLFRAHF
jgi:hypothetical protein